MCSEAPTSRRWPISKARARSFTTCGRCRSHRCRQSLIAVAALAPMIPVALLRIPVAELLKTIGSVVLGKGHG